MLFVFHALDNKDAAPKRQGNYPAHRAHLENTAAYKVTIVMSGPLVADDGQTPVGSMIIIDATTREVAENFFKNDPFAKAGIWDITHISAFKKVKG